MRDYTAVSPKVKRLSPGNAPKIDAAARRGGRARPLGRGGSVGYDISVPSTPVSQPEEFPGFAPRALTWLRDLAANNRREWFEAQRDVYERELRIPLRALVEELDVRLAERVPEIMGDPKRSVFRIHRDVRFSRDKSPYKTHVSCWFFHRRSSKSVGSSSPDGGAAGFYFHLEPRASIVAGGMWMPPRPSLNRIRERLETDQAGFERAIAGVPFKRLYQRLSEEAMLTRLPRGYAEGHPAWRWLRYQSFTASTPLTAREVTSRSLPDLITDRFVALTPLVRWLNTALGYAPATRR